jgi:hypothetical protein
MTTGIFGFLSNNILADQRSFNICPKYCTLLMECPINRSKSTLANVLNLLILNNIEGPYIGMLIAAEFGGMDMSFLHQQGDACTHPKTGWGHYMMGTRA